jgi:hypothetical protein
LSRITEKFILPFFNIFGIYRWYRWIII